MDKTIEQVLKIFNHLAREIQVYMLGGFVVSLNLLIVDYFYYNSSLLAFVKKNDLLIPALILMYIIGHFCMGFYYVLLEWTKIDKKINTFFGFKYQVDSSSLPKLYNKNPELYIHFVERYNILNFMRWNISSACFINFLVDIIFLFKKNYQWQFMLTAIIFVVGAFVFYLLSIETEKLYASRIKSLKDDLQPPVSTSP